MNTRATQSAYGAQHRSRKTVEVGRRSARLSKRKLVGPVEAAWVQRQRFFGLKLEATWAAVGPCACIPRGCLNSRHTSWEGACVQSRTK